VSAPRYLIDSNLLVYPVDPLDAVKRRRAQEVLRRLAAAGSAAIPAPALAEFCNVASRRLGQEVSSAEIHRQVEDLIADFPVLALTSEVIVMALEGLGRHRLPYFDAQIWACAKIHDIPTVLSEDFAAGSTIRGVEIINPLAPEFDPASL